MPMVNVSPIQENEYKFLEDFLYYSLFVPSEYGIFPRDIIFKPEIFAYIEDFGKPDDICFVAEVHGVIVGAAWSRIFAQLNKDGFGNIDKQTPELAVSVLPEYRGRGIGTRLIGLLIRALREKGCSQISLSVHKENPATRLYLRLRFQIVRESADAYIMVLDLSHGAEVPLATLPLKVGLRKPALNGYRTVHTLFSSVKYLWVLLRLRAPLSGFDNSDVV